MKGEPSTSVDELVKQDLVYHNNKIEASGWFMSYQLSYINNEIKRNCIFKVVKKEQKTSCKNCKYYVEIPQLLGLSDIFATEEKEPIRLCDIDRLGEPILGDKWQYGCICFNPKTRHKLKEQENGKYSN